MQKKLLTLLIMTTGLIMSCSTDHSTSPGASAGNYLDASLPVEERVIDLLDRMTLDEKIGQMCQAERGALEAVEDISRLGLGSLLSGGGSGPASNTPTDWADMVDHFQVQALQSRLKIPMIYGVDAVHGHNNVYGAVIFPHNIGLGCTRNPGLVKEAARITAEELWATGCHWTFAPCVAVPRDERWGRTYEGFGETAELAEMMALAAVAGYQGEDLNGQISRLACAKHFVGDGGTENGNDQGNAAISESELRAIHLPGYQAAIDAGVGSIMASYSSWNGDKLHGNKYLLTDLLKGELGFEGFIVSDWAAIDQLPGDYSEDVANSINAGIDMVMVPNQYKNFINLLKAHVQSGRVSSERIDDAVSRILRIKFKMGLFEKPFSDATYLSSFGSSSHRNVARQCVRESLVLLKNDHQVLPIQSGVQRIVVAGLNGNDLGAQCGGWTISWQGSRGISTLGTTLYQAVRRAADDGVAVVYSEDGSEAQSGDLAIAVLGEDPYAEGRGDRNDLSLSQDDQTLINSLADAGASVVGVLISGRPMIITDVIEKCDAFVAAWLPGTEGDGLADILFGRYNFTGKLGHTWPSSNAQIPINLEDGEAGLFPYDYGLSY